LPVAHATGRGCVGPLALIQRHTRHTWVAGKARAKINSAITPEQGKESLALARTTLSNGNGLDIAAAAKEHVEMIFNSDETLIAHIFQKIIIETDTECVKRLDGTFMPC